MQIWIDIKELETKNETKNVIVCPGCGVTQKAVLPASLPSALQPRVEAMVISLSCSQKRELFWFQGLLFTQSLRWGVRIQLALSLQYHEMNVLGDKCVFSKCLWLCVFQSKHQQTLTCGCTHVPDDGVQALLASPQTILLFAYTYFVRYRQSCI